MGIGTCQTRSARRRLVCLAATLATVSATNVVSATPYTWTVGSGLTGLWSTAGNWTSPSGSAIPTVGDSVNYAQPGQFTTMLSATQIADVVNVTDGDVVLRSTNTSTRILSFGGTTGIAVGNGSMAFGAAGASDVAPLFVTVNNALSVGAAIGNGVLVFEDLNTVLNTTNTASNHTIGAGGYSGTMTFRDSAVGDIAGKVNVAVSPVAATRGVLNLQGTTLTLDQLNVATVAGGAEGAVNITGTGARLIVGTGLALGSVGTSGAATLNVGTGATVTLSTTSNAVNATGQILQTGGTFTAAGLTVAGGRIDSTGGSFSFGATATLSAGAVANFTNTLNTDMGLINLVGAGTQLNSAGRIYVNGGSFTYGGGTSGTIGSLGVGNGSVGTLNVNGTLTVNGAIDLNVGQVSIAGTLTQTGTAALTVDGVTALAGQLKIAGGTLNTASSIATITPRGKLLIESNGKWNTTGNVLVDGGQLNAAGGTVSFNPGKSLTVRGGGTGSLANLQTTALAIDVTDANSALTASGTLAGASSIALSAGGKLTAGTLILDASSATVGHALSSMDVSQSLTLRGPTSSVSLAAGSLNALAGATLALSDRATITEAGGQLTLAAGAKLEASENSRFELDNGDLLLPASSSATLSDAALLRVGGKLSLASASTVSVIDSTLTAGSLHITSGNYLAVGGASAFTSATTTSSIGTTAADVSTVTLGANHAFTVAGPLNIGAAGHATVEVYGGASLTLPTKNLSIGIDASSTPAVTVAGANSRLQATLGDITLGGQSVLNVRNAGSVVAGALLEIQHHATLNLDGGTVQAAGIRVGSAGAGTLNWAAGTLHLTAPLTFASGSIFGGSIDLTSGKQLVVNGSLSIASGATVRLAGGRLDIGSLSNAGTFDWSVGTLHVDGNVRVDTPITTGAIGTHVQLAAGQVLTSDATLTVGSAAQLVLSGGSASASSVVVETGGEVVLGSVASQFKATAGPVVMRGTLRGNGSIGGGLQLDAAGRIHINELERIHVAATFDGRGTVALDGGTLQVGSTLTNATTGDITGRGTIIAPAILNSGDIALSSGITDIHGDLTNNSGGRIIVSGNADVSFWDDVTNSAGASIRVSAGSSATFFGTYAGGGTTGTGTVYLEGDVSPGFSPAAVQFCGDLVLGPDARMTMEIGGLAAGTKHDQVHIAGLASLDGVLDVVAVDGFQILPGDVFTLATFAGRSGDVALSFSGNLYAGLGVEKIYSATSLTLRATGLGGDADLDGTVDFDDLLALARHYNQPGTDWFGGDFDRSGTTTFDDLLTLARNYNRSTVTAGGLAELDAAAAGFGADWALAQATVPEPGAMLIAVGATLATRRRKRFA